MPRIVGDVTLGKDHVSAVLVGLARDPLPEAATILRGRPPAPGATFEVVLGSRLARVLALDVGSRIPPFHRNDEGEHVFTVVGVFRSDLPIWEANLVFASFETAAAVFGQKGLATDLLVTCAPGKAEDVRRRLVDLASLGEDDGHGPREPSVKTRADVATGLRRGVLRRGGVFGLHFLLAFAVGIPLVLVTSGVGLVERRRETGLLKATGWSTDEVLLRGATESLLLAVAGGAIAVLLAFLWLRGLRGAGVAPLFFPGLDARPDAAIPFRLSPAPTLAAFAISFAIVATGTLASTWRAASAPPSEAMR